MIAHGNAWKFGNDINTDEIIPARYLNTSDPKELASHCMEDADPEFMNKISMGDVIVAGNNFGCGSSREHAPIAIKAANISCVIAKSFARIFYRNSINIGLPIVESPEAAEDIKPGDKIEIEFDSGKIKNLTTGKEYTAKPFPPFMQDIISKGGLMNKIRSELK
ncbi:MAG TPA: 3-isopropylmalate dehydratase small subunit [Spirochaetota bacterium]|nr:3-isopropylmalate dehydratase small subunit [Spirochaetota bacterium]HQP48611.1 3-isopropylmalate dehydratase small subunit [Spirochaetota bacterium]